MNYTQCKSTLSLCALLLMLLSPAAFAKSVQPQSFAPPTAQDFIGCWEGEGYFAKFNAHFSICFSAFLNDHFYQIGYHVTDATNEVTLYEGYGLWKVQPGDDAIKGNWFDNRGAHMDIAGVFNSDDILTQWSDGSGLAGESRYHLKEDRLIVSDFVRTNGNLQLFSEVTYNRKY